MYRCRLRHARWDRWLVDTVGGSFAAGHVVNAAGAWGDVVATACGVQPIGLEPKRRTAFMIKSTHRDSGHWPLFGDANNSWYVKPDGSQFLCSPSDEIPSEPVDARPDELDVAMAIERINRFTTLDIRSIGDVVGRASDVCAGPFDGDRS